MWPNCFQSVMNKWLKFWRECGRELPTTEALLLGKPQAGKSSIIRGITGVSAEIIGQGFRPHTQNTQRYAYPSEDLPLLVFTDTVGLGDTRRDTQELVAELLEDLNVETRRARILILTVKITDFATDTLQEIARQLRQNHPEIPCLLAITSLHDLYPSPVENHPDYPPVFDEVQRVAQALEASFAGSYDGGSLARFHLGGGWLYAGVLWLGSLAGCDRRTVT